MNTDMEAINGTHLPELESELANGTVWTSTGDSIFDTGPSYLEYDNLALSVRCLMSIGAIMGNLVMVIALYNQRHSWSETNSFTLNVCFQDLFLAGLNLVNLSVRNVDVQAAVTGLLCQFKSFLFSFSRLVRLGECYFLLLTDSSTSQYLCAITWL